jgi:hypothetical protein
MGFLLKIVVFAVAVYGIWVVANRWYRLLGGGRPKPPARAPAAERRETAAAPPRSRGPVVEETRLCSACGSYVSAGAAKCGRTDCPQPA